MGGKETMAATAKNGSSVTSTTQVLTIIRMSVMKSMSVSERNEHR